MGDDQEEYAKCIKEKTKERLMTLGKKTFTLDDLARATEWATEQCRGMAACRQ